MFCNHCKKEQEVITIAGKTYCANCSTVLVDKKIPEADLPKHKMPKLTPTDNEIRTEQLESSPKKENPVIQELSRETKIPDVNKDELEGSAILLDILSDNAKESADKKTLEENKKLEEASEEILDLLGKSEGKSKPVAKTESRVKMTGSGTMKDIRKRNDHLHKKHAGLVKEAEKEVKEEVENLGRIVKSESGYTKEYDIMILSIAITTITLVILTIFMTFR